MDAAVYQQLQIVCCGAVDADRPYTAIDPVKSNIIPNTRSYAVECRRRPCRCLNAKLLVMRKGEV